MPPSQLAQQQPIVTPTLLKLQPLPGSQSPTRPPRPQRYAPHPTNDGLLPGHSRNLSDVSHTEHAISNSPTRKLSNRPLPPVPRKTAVVGDTTLLNNTPEMAASTTSSSQSNSLSTQSPEPAPHTHKAQHSRGSCTRCSGIISSGDFLSRTNVTSFR